MIIFSALGLALLGYLSGSLPFSIWVTRLFKGVDVRDSGSGHATTTNTIRQAGFLPGALVLILDISKGVFSTWLALKYAPVSWIIPLTAAFVVIGHCWPIFAQFRGGMGLACAGGSVLAASPLSFFSLIVLLIALTLTIRHPARASVLTGLTGAAVLWLLGLRGIEIWITIVVGIVIASRFLIDWNRQYHGLWLERQKHR